MEPRPHSRRCAHSSGSAAGAIRRARRIGADRAALQGGRSLVHRRELSPIAGPVQRVEPRRGLRSLGRGRAGHRSGAISGGLAPKAQKVIIGRAMSHPVVVPGMGRRQRPEKPATWKERVEALRYVPALFRLIWRTHRGYTSAMMVLRVIRSVVPVTTFWVGKLI